MLAKTVKCQIGEYATLNSPLLLMAVVLVVEAVLLRGIAGLGVAGAIVVVLFWPNSRFSLPELETHIIPQVIQS